MSRVSELLARERPRPPFDILRAAHAELMVADLDAAEEFYVDRLGLVATARIGRALYLRGWEEHLHHSLVLRQAAAPAVGTSRSASREDSDLDGARQGSSPRSAATAAGRRPSAARAPACACSTRSASRSSSSARWTSSSR